MSTIDSKVCGQCGGTDFNNSGQCRACQKTRSARYYAANKQKSREQADAWRAANPEKTKAQLAAWKEANPEKAKAIKDKWVRENPEKRKQAYTSYVLNNPERAKESSLKYRNDNRDKAKERGREYYVANRDKLRLRQARYYQANPEAVRQRNDAWIKAHPEVARVKTENRRARKLAVGGKLSKGLAKRLHEQQGGACACCGQLLNGKYHLDHIMPLTLGGANTDDNIQLLLPKCNMEKGAMHPDEFMRLRRG